MVIFFCCERKMFEALIISNAGLFQFFFVEETEGLEHIAADRVTTDVMVGR